MADYRAVASVCEGVVNLLRSNYRPEDFNAELQFKVFSSQDFSKPMDVGVSLFLYRIFQDGSHRLPPGRPAPDGRKQRAMLPVNLHFFLTAWAKDASLQNTIAGWMLRTLEDYPVLPTGMLNSKWPGVFREDETVETVLADLTTEDMFRIWETLVQNTYQLSVPYVSRVIRIESGLLLQEAVDVRQRTFVYHREAP